MTLNLRRVPITETNYQSQSRDRLRKILESKMKTIMIGAIASMEEEFSELLDNPDFFDAFTRCRSSILDKGNAQIRNMREELDQYKMDWERYNYKITRDDQ